MPQTWSLVMPATPQRRRRAPVGGALLATAADLPSRRGAVGRRGGVPRLARRRAPPGGGRGRLDGPPERWPTSSTWSCPPSGHGSRVLRRRAQYRRALTAWRPRARVAALDSTRAAAPATSI